MKISFWILATVFFVASVALCKSVHVGTVLFTTTDLFKKCWTECDKSLLKARLIMQDVLPDPDCIDFSNPEAVMILLEYFHACFQIVSTSSYGKIQNLMYLALSDALGGYLRAYMLPFTKKAYYAGQVKYTEARKLFQLYDDIKLFLKTNGIGWAKPQKLSYRKVYVTPLPITGGALEACHQLFIIEKPGKIHCFKSDYSYECNWPAYAQSGENSKEIFPEENEKESAPNLKRFSNFNSTVKLKQIKRNKVKRFGNDFEKLNLTNPMNNSRNARKVFKNLTETISPRRKTQKLSQESEILEVRKSRCDCNYPDCLPNTCPCKRVIVPLPILDDCQSPQSIAVPFKKRPFRNLKTRSSAFVLEYYYIAVIKCFIAKGNTRADIKNFNTKFHSWLISEVYPHLSEEQWYPGFGGVLRVLETIKKFGMDNSAGDPLLQDIGYMFDSGIEFEVAGDKRREKARNVDEFEDECLYSKRHVLTAIIIASLLWIFVFCACAFYFQATRGRKLLYEGGCHNSHDDFTNAQFLSQFFKKRNEQEIHGETKCYFAQCVDELSSISEKKSKTQSKKKSREHRKKHTHHTLSTCRSSFEKIPYDVPPVVPVVSAWACQTSSVPFEKIGVLNFDKQSGKLSKEVQNQTQKNQVQTLWKKPSKKLIANAALKKVRRKRSSKKMCKTSVEETTSEETFEETSSKTESETVEEEAKSIEKQTSSCCCSENCSHTYTTTSNTSSNNEVEEKLSSATMEFFERVISKHKSLKKCSSAPESKEESNREEEEGSSLS